MTSAQNWPKAALSSGHSSFKNDNNNSLFFVQWNPVNTVNGPKKIGRINEVAVLRG